MPENLLGILKLCLLALLYLFFLRVLWAVWNEIRGPSVRDAKPPKSAGKSVSAGKPVRALRGGRRTRRAAAAAAASRLVMAGANGAGNQSFEVATELTVGRAPGCQIPLSADTFVSQHHARVFRTDGQLFVEDLGSTNGTYLNGERVTAAMPMRRGDSLQIGQTVMEVS